ncbi:MAG: hypothetical protein P4M13_10105 [Alphaproteobacteria bacterium]|nr:hypothetical protein [Alphaproteobacteria bacterium]
MGDDGTNSSYSLAHLILFQQAEKLRNRAFDRVETAAIAAPIITLFSKLNALPEGAGATLRGA